MARVPYGETTIEVTLPDCRTTVAEPGAVTTVDPERAADRALSNPHGPSLADRAADADDAAIVVTDVTRATPDGLLVDRLLAELADGGIDPDAVTIVVGLGLHRPVTETELRDLLGEHANRAVNHDPDAAVRVGEVEPPGDDPVPVELHPAVADADLVVSTGLVEPHQYAGFSGGAKTVVIGAGGEPLIRYTHGPELLARPGVRLGRIDDNPFRETLDRAGDVADHEFAVNLAAAPDGVLGAAAGEPRAVVATLAERAREALAVPIDRSFDACVAGVGAPKDANLYQASRAATYVALGAHDPVRSGGPIVVPARLTEGAGTGRGERRFADRLADAASADALYRSMRAGYEPGAQRAFVLARALRDHPVWITNTDRTELVESSLMRAAPTPADAIEADSDVLVVPDALDTLLVRG